ncbi:ankyrin repeat-containing domain protein, partial [Cercophora newfieldiana]
ATPLVSAATNGHLEVVDLLLEKDADVNLPGQNKTSPIRAALQGGHSEVAELLIRDGRFYVSSNDWTPLNSAAGQGFLKVVRLLLQKGADLNKRDANECTALYLASANGHDKVVKRLLSEAERRKADPNELIKSLEIAPASGVTPLIAAATEGHSQVVRLLLDKGTNLDAVGEGKETALKGAIKNGHADVIKLLYD